MLLRALLPNLPICMFDKFVDKGCTPPSPLQVSDKRVLAATLDVDVDSRSMRVSGWGGGREAVGSPGWARGKRREGSRDRGINRGGMERRGDP